MDKVLEQWRKRTQAKIRMNAEQQRAMSAVSWCLSILGMCEV